MSDTIKTQLISALNTFVTAFIPAIATTLTTGAISWTWAFWGAVGLAALRIGVKAVISQFVPVRLGGAK